MDTRLFEAIFANDTTTFTSLVQENKDILEQKAPNTYNTALHLATRFGNVELVKEIVRSRPDMVAAVNGKLETPLHEACCQGNAQVTTLLLEANPSAACKLNYKSQSALFMACSNGHLHLVRLLLNTPTLLDLEEDRVDQTSLHVAASRGHTDIVREILNVRPNFASKTDKYGLSPLHYSCSRDHLEMTKMILTLNEDLALIYDDNGYTPLHLAAITGKAKILEVFEFMAPTSFQSVTAEGETVFHLTVRYNQFDAFMWLVNFSNSSLINRLDQYGCTILHLAVSGKHYQLAEYIINETSVDINHQNNRGHTVLDILNRAGNTWEIQHLKAMLEKAGGKTTIEHALLTPEVKEINHHPPTLENHRDSLDGYCEVSLNSEVGEPELVHVLPIGLNRVKSSPLMNRTRTSFPRLDRDKHQSQRHRKELDQSRHNVQQEIYREALQNARNTIILVAILIATVAFTAGITPPGGVYQDGPLKGKSTVGRTPAFKVFTISNSIALYTSLCLVVVIVSIIPFRRKPLMRLLVVAHKVMWVAVSFMVMAFVSATWVILPRGRGTEWVFEAILSISAGTMGSAFLCFGVMLVRHRLRKSKWRKENGKRMKRNNAGRKGSISRRMVTTATTADIKFEDWSDSYSDAYSEGSSGYHTF